MPESRQARRSQEKQARYDAILDAAEAVFAGQGYEKTAMEDIARKARLSRALLYVYFKDKSAIQRGIMFRAGDSLRRRFTAAGEQADSGRTRIAAMGQAYYRFSQEQPLYFEALTQAASARLEADPEEAQMMACKEEATMALMAGAIERGLEDGSIGQDRVKDPLQTAFYLRGALHGVIMLCRQKELGQKNEQDPGQTDQQLVAYTLQMLTLSLQP